MKTLNRYVLYLALMFSGCVEEFEAEVQDLENILVVDARLTDRVEIQTVYLSRTFEFDSVPVPENKAQVSLIGANGEVFTFVEGEAGVYNSTTSLQLSSGEAYQLNITTQDGLDYFSDFESLPQPIEIGEMEAIRRTSGSGLDGVAIVLDNHSESSQPEFFRYEYEETYKIIVPHFNPFEWDEDNIDYDLNDGDGWEVPIKPRVEESKTCFATDISRDLILASTDGLQTTGLQDYEVRFLSKDNFIISHRYSVLVKQYHHSLEANSYFSTLQDFSGSESVFSNVQPGFVEGNLNSVNPNEQVLGYFELSSYSEKRMFFSFSDIFPNSPLPPYIINCFTGAPPLYPEGFHFTPAPENDVLGNTTSEDEEFIIDGNGNSPLIGGILAGLYAYHAENENYEEYLATIGLGGAAPYLTKPKGCVDCREFGNNEVPEFWEEE